MFLGMAELGDAFDQKSYPGLFTERLSAAGFSKVDTGLRATAFRFHAARPHENQT